MEVPEDKYLILVVLFLDIANTIIRDFIALVSDDKRAAGIATVFFFCFLAVVACIASVFTLLFTLQKLEFCSIFFWAVQLAAILAYYYGDNISYIFNNYAEELGCGEQCIENNRIAAVVLLGSALLVLHIFPLLFRDLAKLVDSKNKSKGWYYALDMPAMLVRIDIVFTTIAVMSQTSNFCSLTDKSLGWSMFVICSLVGIAGLIITSIYSGTKIDDEKSVSHVLFMCGCMTAVVIFLSLALMLYILADNEQPIDCVWKCDSYVSNTTIASVDCNLRANSGMRFGFMTVSLTLVIASLFLLLCDMGTEKDVINIV